MISIQTTLKKQLERQIVQLYKIYFKYTDYHFN
jgi:DNA-binding ferritin-like protein